MKRFPIPTNTDEIVNMYRANPESYSEFLKSGVETLIFKDEELTEMKDRLEKLIASPYITTEKRAQCQKMLESLS